MTAQTFTLHAADEQQMQILGNDIAVALRKGDVVHLHGDLGAGKSTLARAIIRTIAQDLSYEAPSPTFTLVQSYDALRLPLLHADLYRLGDASEVLELGFDAILQQGALLIEWPQQAGEFLPTASLDIRIDMDGLGRKIIIQTDEEAGSRLARSFALRTFLRCHDRGEALRFYLAGDASPRGYEIIETERGQEILMDAPPPIEPPIRDGLSYQEIAHIAPHIHQFAAIDDLLCRQGFCAPKIYASDFDQGILLLEDLGADQIIDDARCPIEARYRAAMDLLVSMHGLDWPHQFDYAGQTVTIPPFDKNALLIEAELLLDWYLPYHRQSHVSETLREHYRTLWGKLFDILEQCPKTLALRDYHSPNIIWREALQGIDRVGIIDFQDAVMAPTAYDVVSLAQDARVDMTPELENLLVDHYISNMQQHDPQFDAVQFQNQYAILGAQRASKILGIFVRLKYRDHKEGYIRHLPRIEDYLRRNLQNPYLSALKEFFTTNRIL